MIPSSSREERTNKSRRRRVVNFKVHRFSIERSPGTREEDQTEPKWQVYISRSNSHREENEPTLPEIVNNLLFDVRR